MAEQRSSRAFSPGAWTLAALVILLAPAACASAGAANHVGWGREQLESERLCQHGVAAACGELGAWLVESGGDDRGFEAGVVLLENACGRDDVAACARLGRIYVRGFKQDAGTARGRELLGHACDRGGAGACTELGEALAMHRERDAHERAASRDSKAPLGLYGKGCKLGDDRGCELLGEAELRDRLSGDRVVGEQALALACGRGRRSSCHLLALERLHDPARTQNGIDLLADNCKHGHVDSCMSLALFVAPLVGRDPSCDKMLPWATLACRGNNVDGCTLEAECRLGAPEGRANAIERLLANCQQQSPLACLYWADAQPADGGDDRRTTEAYAVACQSGLEVACARGAAFELSRAKTTAEAEPPLEWLHRACDRANAEACCALSEALQTATWIAADPSKASALRTKACNQGSARCCDPAKARPAPLGND